MPGTTARTGTGSLVDSVRIEDSDIVLVLDTADHPHIAYRDWNQEELKDARWNGSKWQLSTVDSAGHVGLYASLALDASGNARISYYDSTNYNLKYAAWDGSQWQTQTVDATRFAGQYTSLALDAAGNPHISYYDSSHQDLKYAAWSAGGWQIQTVDSANRVGENLLRQPSTPLATQILRITMTSIAT